jgi:hypothetical protein
LWKRKPFSLEAEFGLAARLELGLDLGSERLEHLDHFLVGIPSFETKTFS